MKINKNSFTVITLILLLSISCKKKSDTPVTPPVVVDTTIVPAVDPPTANTIGFFLDDWQAKIFTTPTYTDAAVISTAINLVTVNASDIITKIPQSEFGHNANTWMTPMVTEPVFLNHTTNLKPHIIRFPAGSGSDAYFWDKPQGVNPPDAPATIMNKDGVLVSPGYGYGRTNNNWQATLDNYYTMLQLTGNKGLLTVNYGYARYGTGPNPVATAAHYAADWVRYDNGRTKYWEIGNENFGDWEWGYRINTATNQDGQPEFLTGKLYAQHFKVFADSMKKAAAEIGSTIYIGAVTLDAPATQAWQTITTRTWNETMIPELNNKADYYVVHSYFTPYNTNSNAAEILGYAKAVPSEIMTYVKQTLTNYNATIKPIAMDEWNMFAVNSKQQVSNISGLFALFVMGENLKNKYGLSARWDLLNGWSNGDDHGLFSAGDEPGIAKWSPRPSFYYMYYFQKLLGDRMVSNSVLGASGLTAYASTFSSGQANITLLNTSTIAQTVEVKVKNFRMGNRFYWYSLQGGTDNGEFSRKVLVNGITTTADAGGPADYTTLKAYSALTTNGIKVTVPARGAVILAIDKK